MRMSQMSKEELKELKNQLIECGKQWVPVGEPLKNGILDNDEEKNKLWIKIFTIAMQIFQLNSQNGGNWHSVAEEEANNDALLSVLTNEVFSNFDCKKSNLYTYMKTLVEERKIDILRHEYGKKYNGKSGEKGIRSFSSLNAKLKEDTETEFQDILPVTENGIEIQNEELNTAQLFELLAMVMKIQICKQGKMSTEAEVWPPTFTGHIISVEQKYKCKVYIGQHKRDIDDALSNGFMKFCMNEECKDSEDIYYGTLKKYGEIDPTSKKYRVDKEIPLPIKGNVVNLFVKIPSKRFYSSYNEYKDIVKELGDGKTYAELLNKLNDSEKI